jgi:hypothetical protein
LTVAFAGLLVFYVVGIFVRQQFGIAITIRNASREPLQQVRVKVETRGNRYGLRDLAPGEQARVFVKPRTESHINLEYIDAHHQPHVELVVGYVEAGYCGQAMATILPGGEVASEEDIDLIACWKSWVDFL